MSVDMKTTEKSNDDGRRKKLLIGCSVAIVILVIAVVALILSRPKAIEPEEVADNGKRPVIVSEDNLDHVFDGFNKKKAPSGNYIVSMNDTVWHFTDGVSPSEDAVVYNLEQNTNAVFFDITLADTGEVIYESPVLSLGTSIDDIKLSKALDKGDYDCIITYHLVDDEQNTISTVRMTLEIIVEN